MIAFISFSVQFHNLPVHSPAQLDAFEDRMLEVMKSLHPAREFDKDVAVIADVSTPIHPEGAKGVTQNDQA